MPGTCSKSISARIVIHPLTEHGRYPGPTLRSLDLLQQEQFRKDILNPEVMKRYLEEGIQAATTG